MLPNGISSKQWDQWVGKGRALVRKKTEVQFALGDLTLIMVSQQPHDFADHGVGRVLDAYASEIGISESALRRYRRVAAAWSPEKRDPNISFTIHEILCVDQKRYTKIKHPPKDPVSGKRRWTVNEALRAVGRTPQHPITSEERMDRIHDLAQNTSEAAIVVKQMLRRPDVAQQVLSDPSSRHVLYHHQRHNGTATEPSLEPGLQSSQSSSRAVPPRSPGVRYTEAPREVLQLLGVCTSFYTQIQRLISDLHVSEYDEETRHTLSESLERVRAAASWAETVINTNDVSMDEALARMLDGES